jgi:hypothetical protein
MLTAHFKFSSLAFLALIFPFLFSGCNQSLNDARSLGFLSLDEMNKAKEEGYKNKADYEKRYLKFGFNSLDEMQTLQKRNYKLKSEYDVVKSLTPDYYLTNCFEINRISYVYFCRGKRISWKIQLLSIDKDWAKFQVLNENKNVTTPPLQIESKSFLDFFKGPNVIGTVYEIDGAIGARNFRFPDIDHISFVEILKTVDSSKTFNSKIQSTR